MKTFSSVLFLIFALAAPAFANVSVSSPASGATVTSPTRFIASASASCSSGVASMGVYVDNKLITVVNGSSLNTTVAMSTGTHNTVVEEWDHCGGATFTAINNLKVTAQPSSSGSPHVSVSSPASGATVNSPTTFVASATTSCSGGVASMGVYVDNKLTTVVNGASLNTAVSISTGTHNAVVEEWDRCGGASYTAVNNLIVKSSSGGSGTPGTPGIPSYAISSGYLNESSHWQWNHDYGTPGGSVGYSSYAVGNPSVDGHAREFYVTYANRGGEIYHVNFGTDAQATHFVYDTYVYMTDPEQVANMEMDTNQVMPNGATMIYGVQCSSYSGTWEFVTVSGSSPHWRPSNLSCNPKSWSRNAWHHVQIASHRNTSGVVTYDWVALDGNTRYFSGANGFDELWLGWAYGSLVANFQLDGAYTGSGSMTVFTDKLTVYRW